MDAERKEFVMLKLEECAPLFAAAKAHVLSLEAQLQRIMTNTVALADNGPQRMMAPAIIAVEIAQPFLSGGEHALRQFGIPREIREKYVHMVARILADRVLHYNDKTFTEDGRKLRPDGTPEEQRT